MMTIDKKYALSTQAEPFVSVMVLATTPQGLLELGVWPDKLGRYYFLDGVPFDIRHDDIEQHTESWDAVLYMLNYDSEPDPEHMERLARLASNDGQSGEHPSFLALTRLLSGTRQHPVTSAP